VAAVNLERRRKMLGKISAWFVIVACLVTMLNVVLVAVSVSTRSAAAVAGMRESDLYNDRDFERAVKHMVEEYCEVVEGRKIHCRSFGDPVR
jgi:hypothetical protein